MTTIGQIERKTQSRVVKLFREQLGYDYLGDWSDRVGNRNIETEYLTAWLKKRGVDDALITRALHLLERRHNERFKALLDRHFPDWKKIRAELNEIPLSHEEWS